MVDRGYPVELRDHRRAYSGSGRVDTPMGVSPGARRHPRLRRSWLVGYAFAAPWLFGFFFLYLGPIALSFYYSLTDYSLLSSPRFVGLANYGKLLTDDPRFVATLYNSGYYTALSVPLYTAGALLTAMLLNHKLVGMRVFRTIYYLPAVVSGVSVAILWRWLLNPEFGLVNWLLSLVGIQGPGWLLSLDWAKPGFVLMHVWGLGTGMVIFLAGLQGIPRNLYDAAEMDGANGWRKFWHVTVPMLSPTIFFVVVTESINSLQVFTPAFIMSGSSVNTVGGPADATLFYVLYLFLQGFVYFRMGYASAMAWILFVLVLLLTLVQFALAGRWVYYEGNTRGA